jgi:hypothetical protein
VVVDAIDFGGSSLSRGSGHDIRQRTPELLETIDDGVLADAR